MNKKAFLLGEYTLKIIIAVLSISLLLYLLFVIYGSFTDDQKLKQAEATLNEISEKMEFAKETGGMQDVVLLSPSKWTLINYFGEDKPEECIRNCICLCKTDTIFTPVSNLIGLGPSEEEKRISQIENCNENGKCISLDENLNEIFIKIPIDIQIKYSQGKFEITKI